MIKLKGKPAYITQDNGEVVIKHRDHTFILKEKARGVYGIGKSIGLYKLNPDLTTTHLVEVGWTQTDNHGTGPGGLIKQFTNMAECKIAAIKYIDNLLA